MEQGFEVVNVVILPSNSRFVVGIESSCGNPRSIKQLIATIEFGFI